MLPNYFGLEDDETELDFEIEKEPSRTYLINFEKGRALGFCDGKKAMEQAIYKVLNTQRYEHLIYSERYGAELFDLIGEEFEYARGEVKDRIKEALLEDDRIEEVYNFLVEADGNSLLVSFTAETELGDIDIRQEVNI